VISTSGKDSAAVKLQLINDGILVDKLRDAVNAHVHAWEDDVEQARHRRQDELSAQLTEANVVAARWREEHVLAKHELARTEGELALVKAKTGERHVGTGLHPGEAQ
jgi:hypothetical protein